MIFWFLREQWLIPFLHVQLKLLFHPHIEKKWLQLNLSNYDSGFSMQKKKKKIPLQNITCNDRHQDSVLVTGSWNHLRPESVFRIQRLRKIWGPKGKENEITKHVTWPWGHWGWTDHGQWCLSAWWQAPSYKSLTWSPDLSPNAQNIPGSSSLPKLRPRQSDQPGFACVLTSSGALRSQLCRHSAFNMGSILKASEGHGHGSDEC